MQSAKPSNNNDPRRNIFWDINLQIIFSITLMAVLGVASITPAFPKMVKELNLSSGQIGLLITIFTLPGVIMTPILGVLADHRGRKRILIPSMMVFGVAGGACAFARDMNILLGLRFLQGAAAASLGSLSVTLIGDLYSGKTRAKAMGYNASVLSIGTACYPAIGGALAMMGWYYPFALPFLAIPIGIFVLFSLKNPEPKNNLKLQAYFKEAFQRLKQRQMIGLFLASIGTFIILYGAYLIYFPLLIGESFGGSSFIIGLMMSAMSLATAITASQLGRLSAIFSESTLLKVSFILYAIALIMIPFCPRIWLLLMPTVIFGIAHGINFPSVQTLLASMAPLEQRGAIMAIYGMVLRLGQTLGPVLTGAVVGLLGINSAFYVGAGFSLFMCFLLVLMLK